MSALEQARWYHTIDLGDGRVTPGWFDVRPAVPRVPLPADLAGRRVLDVGTWDGFWAFELERRGAAEVIAIDLEDPRDWDWPAAAVRNGGVDFLRGFKAGDRGFHLAHAALGSRVERRDASVYDLDPAVHGTFDLVFVGDLLLHLRDPVRALERVAAVAAGGSVVLYEGVDPVATWTHPRTPLARLDDAPRGTWWVPNRAGLLQMAATAGLTVDVATGLFFVPFGTGQAPPAARTCVPLTRAGRQNLVLRSRGVPHVALRARA